jgi:hypothetical protein
MLILYYYIVYVSINTFLIVWYLIWRGAKKRSGREVPQPPPALGGGVSELAWGVAATRSGARQREAFRAEALL